MVVLLIAIGGAWFYLNAWIEHNGNRSLDEEPHGKFIKKLDSPTYTYTVRIYNVPSIEKTSVRVEILFNKANKKPKTIYYEYNRSYPDPDSNIKWLKNDVIDIYGHHLNVLRDTYNWQKDPNWDKERDQ